MYYIVESLNRLGQWEREENGVSETREEAERDRAELIEQGADWTEENTRVRQVEA